MLQSNKQERLEKRNERIKKRFNYLTAKKHFSTEHTLAMLADEYLELTESTIWLIITETGFYKTKKQNENTSTIPNLFTNLNSPNQL